MNPASLIDSFARRFRYLRLSVTDACNFRCRYCLPNGYQKSPVEDRPLGREEVRRLTMAFAELGVWKVRVTGGEPTLRKDILELLSVIASVPGVRQLALSTNGYRLGELAPELRRIGVQSLNVSIDSLDRERFHQLTGHDRLPEVLNGVDGALKLGFPTVKINAVLCQSSVGVEFEAFRRWVKETPVSVRFIELMPTETNASFFQLERTTSTGLQARLLSEGWRRLERAEAAGPAVEFSHPDYRGRFGLIAPYSPQFCSTCNRLRVSARGDLKLCLFGEGGLSLRPLLRSDDQRDLLCRAVISALADKKQTHPLHEGQHGEMRTFSQIGG